MNTSLSAGTHLLLLDNSYRRKLVWLHECLWKPSTVAIGWLHAHLVWLQSAQAQVLCAQLTTEGNFPFILNYRETKEIFTIYHTASHWQLAIVWHHCHCSLRGASQPGPLGHPAACQSNCQTVSVGHWCGVVWWSFNMCLVYSSQLCCGDAPDIWPSVLPTTTELSFDQKQASCPSYCLRVYLVLFPYNMTYDTMCADKRA